MAEIKNITYPEFQELIDKIRDRVEEERMLEADIVYSRWKKGQDILKYYAKHGHYGEGFIKQLADASGYSASLLYRCVQFAERCPSMELLGQAIEDHKNWYGIVQELPSNLKGKRGALSIASKSEKVALQVREFADNTPDLGEQKEEILGCLKAVVQEYLEVIGKYEDKSFAGCESYSVDVQGLLYNNIESWVNGVLYALVVKDGREYYVPKLWLQWEDEE